MDKKSTVRMLPAPGDILKKLDMLMASRMAINAMLRFRFFMVSAFSFLMVWTSGYQFYKKFELDILIKINLKYKP